MRFRTDRWGLYWLNRPNNRSVDTALHCRARSAVGGEGGGGSGGQLGAAGTAAPGREAAGGARCGALPRPPAHTPAPPPPPVASRAHGSLPTNAATPQWAGVPSVPSGSRPRSRRGGGAALPGLAAGRASGRGAGSGGTAGAGSALGARRAEVRGAPGAGRGGEGPGARGRPRPVGPAPLLPAGRHPRPHAPIGRRPANRRRRGAAANAGAAELKRGDWPPRVSDGRSPAPPRVSPLSGGAVLKSLPPRLLRGCGLARSAAGEQRSDGEWGGAAGRRLRQRSDARPPAHSPPPTPPPPPARPLPAAPPPPGTTPRRRGRATRGATLGSAASPRRHCGRRRAARSPRCRCGPDGGRRRPRPAPRRAPPAPPTQPPQVPATRAAPDAGCSALRPQLPTPSGRTGTAAPSRRRGRARGPLVRGRRARPAPRPKAAEGTGGAAVGCPLAAPLAPLSRAIRPRSPIAAARCAPRGRRTAPMEIHCKHDPFAAMHSK